MGDYLKLKALGEKKESSKVALLIFNASNITDVGIVKQCLPLVLF